MRKLLIILFVIICQDSFCQDYIGYWNRTGAKIDSVQRSIDGKNFTTIATVFGGYDSLILTPPVSNYFFRVKAGNNISNVVIANPSTTPVEITGWGLMSTLTTVTMQWTSQSEEGGYYEISKSTDAAHWTVVKTVPEKGNSTYIETMKK